MYGSTAASQRSPFASRFLVVGKAPLSKTYSATHLWKGYQTHKLSNSHHQNVKNPPMYLFHQIYLPPKNLSCIFFPSHLDLFRGLILLIKLPHRDPNLPIQKIPRTLLRHRHKRSIRATSQCQAQSCSLFTDSLDIL